MKRYTIDQHGVQYTFSAPEGSLLGDRVERTGLPYEPWLLEDVYNRELDGVAVDVGAHYGNHTLWFRLVCGLDVVAFEPIFQYELRYNLELNGLLDSVVVHDVALGDSYDVASDAGDRVITEYPSHDPGANGRWEGRVELGHGSIRVRPLDSFAFLGKVALLKVDVEGMDAKVLRGAAGTIGHHKPVVYVEVKDDEAHRKVASVLEPLGYEQTGKFKRGTPVEVWER